MGIKDLYKLLEKYSPNAIKNIHLSKYNNKKVAIDISIYLYQYKYSEKNILNGFIKQLNHFKKFNITPIYIFDGKPPKQKEITLETRSKNKENMINKIKELKEIKQKCEDNNQIKILDKEIEQVEKNVIYIKNSDKKRCIKLFNSLGIPYIKADGEAEELCSRLCKSGLVYGCISDDSDILANCGNILIRKYSNRKNNILEYNLNEILKNMELEHTEFIDLCILCGCDYVPRICNIGPINAYKLIKKYRKIETIIEVLQDNKKYKIPENYKILYEDARNLFQTKIDVVEYKNKLEYNNTNKTYIDELLKEEEDLNVEDFNKFLGIKNTQTKQKSIKCFFETE